MPNMPNELEKKLEVTEGFDFIREKIKDKPLNKKKILIYFGLNLFFAIVFGLVACVTFLVAKPYINDYISKLENPTITIPKDEQETIAEENQESEAQEEATKTEKVYITNTQPLEVTDYENLQSEIYDIGSEVNKSIVTVTGHTSDIDLFNDTYENERKNSGLIIGDNGQELLILTEKSTIDGVDSIMVSFINSESFSAEIKNYDANTGIVVLSIPLSDISEEAKASYKGATLGNSFVIRQGTTIMALGSFSGNNYAIAQGNITASSGVISTVDIDFTVLATNIPGSGQGSGVLINLKGEVIGLILKAYSSVAGESTVTALSISELKEIIERLSNNEKMPYLGVKGTTVTEEDVQKYGLSKGVYVSNVAIDSPAMGAGIQNNDVIIKFNDQEILTTNDYEKALLASELNTEVKITVMRSGVDEYKEIECIAVVNVLQ